MKQLLLLAAACCIITVSKAQITKGSTMIGGTVGYVYSDENSTDSSSVYRTNKTNQYFFGVSYGKCFKENTFWGVTASFSYTDSKGVYTYNNTNNNYQYRNLYIGVFERKYYPIITNFYCFGQAGLGFSYVNNEGTNSSSNKGYSIGLYAYPGISYKAFKNIYLETSLRDLLGIGFNHYESTYSTMTTTQNSFVSYFQLPTQILQTLDIGVTIILGK